MTHDEAFLQDIRAAPDDDGPRRVYADWLEDNGQPARADFLRAQIELARLPPADPARRAASARAHALLVRHQEGWVGRLADLADGWTFHRGLVDEVTVGAEELLAHADELFRLAPLRRLRLTGAEGRVKKLAALYHLAALTELDLSCNRLESGDARALAASPHLANLRRLDLAYNRITDDGAAALTAARALDRLDHLQLGANPIRMRARDGLLAHFGARAHFDCAKGPDYLFHLTTAGLRWLAGHARAECQVLLVPWRSAVTALFFDWEGNLLECQVRHVPRPPSSDTDACEATSLLTRAWQEEMGVREATIRVKKFALPEGSGLDGYGIDDEPPAEPGFLHNPDEFTPEERAEALYFLEWWGEEGMFTFGWGECWLNREGELVAT
jgi:uncharacterized protein (TIGR02996 family)